MGQGWERFKDEVGEMAERKLNQGCTELAMALNSDSTSFAPYGEGQKSLTVHGPEMDYQQMLKDAGPQQAAPEHAAEVAPAQAIEVPQASYQDMLREASQREAPEHDRDVGMDR